MQLHAQRVGNRMQRRLGGTVHAGERRGGDAGHTADIDDQALGGAQQLGAVANQLQRGKDVGVELAQQGLAIGIHDWPHGTVPGVVDQKVQAPGLLANLLDTLPALGRVIHIEFDGDGALVSQRGQGVDTARGGEYLIAGVQAGQRQSLTDAGRTAGDQGDGLGHGWGSLLFFDKVGSHRISAVLQLGFTVAAAQPRQTVADQGIGAG